MLSRVSRLGEGGRGREEERRSKKKEKNTNILVKSKMTYQTVRVYVGECVVQRDPKTGPCITLDNCAPIPRGY